MTMADWFGRPQQAYAPKELAVEAATWEEEGVLLCFRAVGVWRGFKILT